MNTSGSTKTITRAVQVTLQIAYDHWLRTGGPIKPAEYELVASDVIGAIPVQQPSEPEGKRYTNKDVEALIAVALAADRMVHKRKLDRCLDLAGELQHYFDSEVLDVDTDLYLLLLEVEAMRQPETKGEKS